MTIAIVIGTHDWAVEQLLKTVEMLLGEQESVDWIDFVPGKNTEAPIEKHNTQLAKLDTSKGVLFLVNTWGGSPFNVASRIVIDKGHYEVIVDVNTPMLVETFMARDDNSGFDELVALAVETGSEGVKALKAKPVEKAASILVAAPKVVTPAKSMGPNDYMQIGLARIDDRLIHGQVATRWTKEINVTCTIVVSDEVAADTVRRTLLTQAAPSGVTTHVVDVAKMIRVYNNPKCAGERVMLLFTNPTDVERIVEGGVKITSVNTGGMAFCRGETQISNAISVDDKDIEAFRKLNERGVELEARKVSTDQKLKMTDLTAKVKQFSGIHLVFTLKSVQQ